MRLVHVNDFSLDRLRLLLMLLLLKKVLLVAEQGVRLEQKKLQREIYFCLDRLKLRLLFLVTVLLSRLDLLRLYFIDY